MTDVKEEAFKQACRDILERHKIRREQKIDAAVRAALSDDAMWSVLLQSHLAESNVFFDNSLAAYRDWVCREFAKL